MTPEEIQRHSRYAAYDGVRKYCKFMEYNMPDLSCIDLAIGIYTECVNRLTIAEAESLKEGNDAK